MTDKEKLDAITEEIHRLVNVRGYDRRMANDLFTFIDSLPNEPISEDLEAAAKHYLYSNILYDDVYVGNPTDKDCIEMFKAGANWQKHKDAEAINENALLYSARLEGIEIGKAEMKQQLMAKAVKVNISNLSIISLPTDCGLKVGDKLLVIKEDKI